MRHNSRWLLGLYHPTLFDGPQANSHSSDLLGVRVVVLVHINRRAETRNEGDLLFIQRPAQFQSRSVMLDHYFDEHRCVLAISDLADRTRAGAKGGFDTPGSFRMITNGDCFRDGVPVSDVVVVLQAEDDVKHYSRRPDPPGVMHPDTERFIREHGGLSAAQGDLS